MKYKFGCGCEFDMLEENPPEGVQPLLDLNIEELNYDCPAVWKLLGKGLCKGIFQLETGLGRSWTKKLKPETLENLSALGSILRPGCLANVDENNVSVTKHFVMRKNKEEEIKSFHPIVDAILASTYNLLVYQEQAMALAVAIAGFTPEEADILRRAIGKKIAEEMAKCKVMFIDGAKKKGIVSEVQAAELFDWIEKSQRYSFNKCVSKNERFRKVAKGKFNYNPTIEEMYRIKNDIEYAKNSGHISLYKKYKLKGYGKALSLCLDGRVRANTIIDIQTSGLQKIFNIKLINGSEIKTTINHKFPTTNGEMTVEEIINSIIKPKLFICGEYEETDFSKITRFSNIQLKEMRILNKDKKVNHSFGENNCGYTNGSYSEFKKNNEIIPLICELCDKSNKEARLELHHKNKDRTNSSLENLSRLCSSCHKKEEYKNGRMKRGEKGYPIIEIEILSIEECGEEETYDITMEGPNHNFVLDSNIITCNSHAYSYGLTGYDCAYIKAHFPLAFFTSWLLNSKHESHPQDEVFELVNDAKLFDVEIQPPDLRSLEPDFHTDRKVVKFGLSNIKGVGDNTLVKVIESVTKVNRIYNDFGNGEFGEWNWYQTLTRLSSHLSPSIFIKFIEAGALSWLKVPRQVMLAEFRVWNDLTEKEQKWMITNSYRYSDLISLLKDGAKAKKIGGASSNKNRTSFIESQIYLLENPTSSLNDSPHWISYKEEDLLGIPLTCSKIDSCDISEVNCTCKEFLAGRTGYIMLGVNIQSVNEIKTKKGKNPGSKMGRLVVSDGTCCLDDVVCFPEQWKDCKDVLLENNNVIIQVDRDFKDKTSTSAHIKKAWQAIDN